MRIETFYVNGKTHVLKESEPLEGECGVRPIVTPGAVGFSSFDSRTEVPKNACRQCLMQVAMSDDVIGEEPLDTAKDRGYEPKDADDFEQLGLL